MKNKIWPIPQIQCTHNFPWYLFSFCKAFRSKLSSLPFLSLCGAISWYCDFVLVSYFIGSGFWSMVSCCQTFSSFWLLPKILYSYFLNFGALVLFLFFFLIWLFSQCCIVLGPLDSGALTTRRSFPWLWQIQVDSRNHKYNTNTDKYYLTAAGTTMPTSVFLTSYIIIIATISIW